jgi:peptidyl-prolyl cis-trans isomerase SurA
MKFLKGIAASVLLSCVVAFSVTAQPNTESSETLFFINKKPVASNEFVYLYRKNHQHKPEEFTKDKIDEYLELFINYKLKVEEALFRGMDTTAKFKNEYQTYRDELLKPYLPDAKVVDSMVALTYERLKEEVKASHILVALKPDPTPEDTLAAYRKISELRMRALAGEDFEALAARFSEEPGAEETKGNLGYFTAMQMVFPFEQAAYTIPVGGVSTPVRTQFGYHVLKVWDRQPTRGEVEVSHIMIRSSDPVNDEEAKNTIFDIYDKLDKGMDWEDLCRQYSEDPNSKDKGGKLRPFGVGAMAAIPEFQEMAFSLQEKGEISDPVQTRYGWHILRLESRIPLPSFEEIKTALTQRVSRDARVAISKEALRQEMRSQFGYTENVPAKEEIMKLAEHVVYDSGAVAKEMEKEPLFHMNNRPYKVKEFLNYLSSQVRPPSMPATDYLEQQFAKYVQSVQLRLMEEKVKQESPDYKWLLKEYYEGILLFDIMEKEVWNKAMEDTVGQRKYFQQHAADFKAGERILGRIFSASSSSTLNEFRNLVESKDPAYTDFMKTHRIRLDSGSFEKGDRAVLAEITFAPGIYSVGNSGLHYLVAVDKILPPGPKTFDEARASVISDYQTFLEDSWISELKRKFGVKLNKKAKKRAFTVLMED